MQLTSSSFQHGAEIPAYYTSDGDDASPELSWQDAPPKRNRSSLSCMIQMRASPADLRIGLCITFHQKPITLRRMYPIPKW